MMARVQWPWRAFGSRNALMLLLTASTPVIAVQPPANARNSNHTPAPCVAAGIGVGAAAGCGGPCANATRNSPSANRPAKHARNR